MAIAENSRAEEIQSRPYRSPVRYYDRLKSRNLLNSRVTVRQDILLLPAPDFTGHHLTLLSLQKPGGGDL